MIVSLRGTVIACGRDHVVIEVNGIGYQVFTPDPHLVPLNSQAFLHTVLIVRDDGLSLYGFPDSIGSELFRNLLRVGGIGPRLALAILATMRTDSLRQAIQGERADLITRVPGVGRKTAEKIVLELRDKLGDRTGILPGAALSESDSEVMDALTALGYSLVEAQTALQSLPVDAPEAIEERVRLALQSFT